MNGAPLSAGNLFLINKPQLINEMGTSSFKVFRGSGNWDCGSPEFLPMVGSALRAFKANGKKWDVDEVDLDAKYVPKTHG